MNASSLQLELPVLVAGRHRALADLTLTRVGAEVLVVRSVLVLEDPDEPCFELQSVYAGTPTVATRSVHVLRTSGTVVESIAADHDDGRHPEHCMPLFRPGECVLDHATRIVDATGRLVHPGFLAPQLDDELLTAVATVSTAN